MFHALINKCKSEIQLLQISLIFYCIFPLIKFNDKDQLFDIIIPHWKELELSNGYIRYWSLSTHSQLVLRLNAPIILTSSKNLFLMYGTE